MADRTLLRRAGGYALLVAVLLCVAGIFQHGLWTPDEPREAEVGREMLLSYFSAMPTLGGQPFLEKPPLFAWVQAAVYTVFGVNEGAARMASAAFSIGAMWVAYLMGKAAAGRLAGLCSAIVLGTMWQFSETSHKAVLDTALTFFVAAGHLAFLRLWKTEVRSLTPYLHIGVWAGLAFLTKAWIGPALMCAPPILAAAAMRDWSYVRRVLPLAFVAAVLGVAAFGLPWVFALAATPGGGWDAVRECLYTEYVGRTVGGTAEFTKGGHANDWHHYLYTWPYVVAPWVFVLPAMFKGSTLSRSWRGGRSLWLGLIFVAGLVLLSIPSGKRDLYLVPLLPAAAVPAGVWLSRVGSRRGGPWDTWTVSVLFWLPYAVCVLLAMLLAASAIPNHLDHLADAGPFTRVWGAIGAVTTIVLIELSRRRPHPAAQAATVLVSLFVCLGLFGRPQVDPPRNMEAGSREIAALVPFGEKLVGLSADETMLGVVPFYSGRTLENAETYVEAEAALASGATRHLIVMHAESYKVPPRLKRRLVLVKTVMLSATRPVHVYELKR